MRPVKIKAIGKWMVAFSSVSGRAFGRRSGPEMSRQDGSAGRADVNCVAIFHRRNLKPPVIRQQFEAREPHNPFLLRNLFPFRTLHLSTNTDGKLPLTRRNYIRAVIKSLREDQAVLQTTEDKSTGQERCGRRLWQKTHLEEPLHLLMEAFGTRFTSDCVAVLHYRHITHNLSVRAMLFR
ncbi:unnamed protein product [Leuciscus chuanchicus]